MLAADIDTGYAITAIGIGVTAGALVILGDRISCWIRDRRQGGGR